VGVVVPAHRRDELVAAVLAALDGGRRPDRDAGRAQALARFDWSARADAYGAVLRRAMARR
jgi:hypothetical protein